MIDIGLIAPDLELREDGIWYSKDQRSVSYPVDGHAACFALEDSSFWFAHRNACIVAAVKTFPPPKGGAIFDVGGGNGFVARGLLDAGFDAVLLEPGMAGAHNAKKRGVQNIICATTETARIRSDSIPAVGLFDVIEHIEDDGGFLRSLRSKVKRGGHLYATVPAFNVLWAKEDATAGHFRRYTRGGICKAIADAGFDILFSSYIFRPLPLPIFLFRVLPHWLRLDLTKDAEQGPARTRREAAAGLRECWIACFRRRSGTSWPASPCVSAQVAWWSRGPRDRGRPGQARAARPRRDFEAYSCESFGATRCSN